MGAVVGARTIDMVSCRCLLFPACPHKKPKEISEKGSFDKMTVKELIRRLRKENQNLKVQQFAHDHDPEKHDEGTGYTCSVYEITDDKGNTFVALST